MNIAELQKDLGLTLKDFGALLGLKSVGHVHQIVTGAAKPSRRVAKEIARLSRGRIRAEDLNPNALKVRRAA